MMVPVDRYLRGTDGLLRQSLRLRNLHRGQSRRRVLSRLNLGVVRPDGRGPGGHRNDQVSALLIVNFRKRL